MFPTIQQLLHASSWTLSREECDRFVQIFDYGGNGVISADEFLSFCQFFALVACLEAKAEADDEEEQIMNELDEEADLLAQLIEEVKADRSAIQANLHRLPEDVGQQLGSAEFAQACRDKFVECDEDGNGVLTPDELFPIIEELLKVWGDRYPTATESIIIHSISPIYF